MHAVADVPSKALDHHVGWHGAGLAAAAIAAVAAFASGGQDGARRNRRGGHCLCDSAYDGWPTYLLLVPCQQVSQDFFAIRRVLFVAQSTGAAFLARAERSGNRLAACAVVEVRKSAIAAARLLQLDVTPADEIGRLPAVYCNLLHKLVGAVGVKMVGERDVGWRDCRSARRWRRYDAQAMAVCGEEEEQEAAGGGRLMVMARCHPAVASSRALDRDFD